MIKCRIRRLLNLDSDVAFGYGFSLKVSKIQEFCSERRDSQNYFPEQV